MSRPNPESREVARFDNTPENLKLVRTLQYNLNTAIYKSRVRGRKPDNELIKADGMRVGVFGSDGDIPKPYAKELVLYIEGITTPEFVNLDGMLNKQHAKIRELEAEVKALSQSYGSNTEDVDLINTISDERNTYRQKAEVLQEKYDMQQRELCDMKAELQQAKDGEQWEATQYAKCKRRLIRCADEKGSLSGQVSDLTLKHEQMFEQAKADDRLIKHKDVVIRLTKKRADGLQKFKDFFMMLKELKGVDISITNKGGE